MYANQVNIICKIPFILLVYTFKQKTVEKAKNPLHWLQIVTGEKNKGVVKSLFNYF